MQTIHRHNKGVGREGGEGRGVEVSPTQNTKSFQVFVNIKLLTKSLMSVWTAFWSVGHSVRMNLSLPHLPQYVGQCVSN